MTTTSGKRIYRRLQICAIFLFIISIPNLFAFSGEGWEINLETNLDFNFTTDTDKPIRMYDYEYIEGFNNRPLIQVDLALFHGPWYFITEGSILSIRPGILVNTTYLFRQMVKLAYLEYDNEFVYFSAGRRKQQMGVSRYGLFVNRDMPFYDGINLSVGKNTGFKFDSLVSTSNLSQLDGNSSPDFINEDYTSDTDLFYSQYSKYFLYHALSYTAETWHLMIGESAVLANPKSLGDLSVFPNLHNENSDRANVGLEIQFAKIMRNDLLLYLMVAIDDLPAEEGHTTHDMLSRTPNGMAIGAGLKWHIINGESFEYPTHNSSRGIRKNTQFGNMEGGLTISLDYAATSRWMYVRTVRHESSQLFFAGFQSFYNYFLYPYHATPTDHFSVPFGLKYGGDSQLIVLQSSYETKNLKLTGIIELLLQGQEGREERTFNNNYWGSADLSEDSHTWITSGNIEPKLTVQLTMEKDINSWLTAYAGVTGIYATYLPFEAIINFGVTSRF